MVRAASTVNRFVVDENASQTFRARPLFTFVADVAHRTLPYRIADTAGTEGRGGGGPRSGTRFSKQLKIWINPTQAKGTQAKGTQARHAGAFKKRSTEIRMAG